jgi:aconitate hydratase
MPAGARVLPYHSNFPKIAEFAFERIDPTYADRAKQIDGHIVGGGANYRQGSSREHAALAPRFLGLGAVLAKSFARIHAQDLVNFGVLPLTFSHPADYNNMQGEDVLRLNDLRRALAESDELPIENATQGRTFKGRHSMSPRQIEYVLLG